MPNAAESLKAVIATELSDLADERAVAAIRNKLIEPRASLLDWDYGSPNQKLLCWTVFHDSANDTEIAYCEEGFGPSRPWGLVSAGLRHRERSMGMDSGWFETFLLAWFESFAATELTIWSVFEEDADGLRRAVSGELAWDAVWLRRDELASANIAARYHVDTPLRAGGSL